MRKTFLGKCTQIIVSVCLLLSTFVSVSFAQTNLDAEMTFRGSSQTRKEITEYLPDSKNDTMIWEGEFKTAQAGIQALVSVCGETTNEYLTLYVNNGNQLGYEFRVNGKTSAKVATLNKTYKDQAYHKYRLKVSPLGYELYFDDVRVAQDTTSQVFTSMNSYNTKKMYLGGMNRVNSNSNWYFNGSMRNVKITGLLSTQAALADFSANGGDFSKGNSYKVVSEQVPAFLKSMEKGSFTFTYRLNENSKTNNSLMTLFSMKEKGNNNDYATFYVKPGEAKFGVEVKGGIGHVFVQMDRAKVQNTQWHTVTFVFDGAKMSVTLDDGAPVQADASGFLKNASWKARANEICVGGMERNVNNWYLSGYMGDVNVFNRVLSSEEIAKLHETTANATYPIKTDAISKSEATSLFYPQYQNSKAYRIPSLLTTSKGTVIAGIDQRHDGAQDWDNIDAMVRRKEKDATAFSDPIVVMDLLEFGNDADVFLIDMSLMSAKLADGRERIFMLMDMFPQSYALVDSGLQCSSGYKTVDGKRYLKLTGDDQKEYTVRDGGVIYDDANQPTKYRFQQEGTKALKYKDIGTIYDDKDVKCGNAYVYRGSEKGIFHVDKTSYLWLTYSDDDGKTWSSPKDLNGQVKEDWMKFMGTGPGVGIQLTNNQQHPNRLVYPVYHANNNVGGSQASNVIYSDDFGETWTLATSPIEKDGHNPSTMANGGAILTESQVVELNNGHLVLFMRNGSGKVKQSISVDGGKTWERATQTSVPHVYCQVSALHVNYKEKEYVILSNPIHGGRYELSTIVGEVKKDDTITWSQPKIYHYGHGQYSCLSEIKPGVIGVLYEGHDTSDALHIQYTTFTMDYLLSNLNLVNPVVTNMQSNFVKKAGNRQDLITTGDKYEISVTTNEPIFVSGTPQLALKVSGVDKYASYVSGNGTKVLKFEYVVEASDTDGAILAQKQITTKEGVAETIYNVPFMNGTYQSIGSIGYNFASNVNDLTITSAQSGSENWGATSNAYDKDTNTFWHSKDQATGWITLDLGKACYVEGLRYLPRQDTGTNGNITEYKIYAGMDANNLVEVARGTWDGAKQPWRGNRFTTPQKARYIKLVGVRGLGGFANAAEIGIFGKNYADYTKVDQAIQQANALNAEDYVDFTPVTNAVNAVVRDQFVSEQAAVDAMAKAITDAIASLENVAPPVCTHSETRIDGAKEATCTEKGSTGKTVCTKCGHVVKDAEDIPALEHDLTTTTTVATCSTKGTVTTTCSRCEYKDVKELPATGKHTFSKWVVVKEATTTSEGMKERVCSTCKKKEQERIEKLTYIVSKTNLEALLKLANTYSSKEYTQQSYQALQEVMQACTTLMNRSDVQQSEIDEACNLLKQKMDALVKVEAQKPNNPQNPSKPNTEDVKDETNTSDSTNMMMLWMVLGFSFLVFVTCVKARKQ